MFKCLLRERGLFSLSLELVLCTMLCRSICINGVNDTVEHFKNSCYFSLGISF